MAAYDRSPDVGLREACSAEWEAEWTPRIVRYVQTQELIMVTSPEGDVVTGYSINTGKAKSFRLPKAGDTKLEVQPIAAPTMAALQLKGPKINQIAVFNAKDGSWYPQDLREPVDKAIPLIGNYNMAAYGLGRRVYAFSPMAKRWDILELPEGVVAKPVMGASTIMCENKGHLYVFSFFTGTGKTSTFEVWPLIRLGGEVRSRKIHETSPHGMTPRPGNTGAVSFIDWAGSWRCSLS